MCSRFPQEAYSFVSPVGNRLYKIVWLPSWSIGLVICYAGKVEMPDSFGCLFCSTLKEKITEQGRCDICAVCQIQIRMLR